MSSELFTSQLRLFFPFFSPLHFESSRVESSGATRQYFVRRISREIAAKEANKKACAAANALTFTHMLFGPTSHE